MSIALSKLACFIQDESGQGTIEYAGMLALGALLVAYGFVQGKAIMEPALLGVFNVAKSYMAQIT